jgi:hypothetical protein
MGRLKKNMANEEPKKNPEKEEAKRDTQTE